VVRCNSKRMAGSDAKVSLPNALSRTRSKALTSRLASVYSPSSMRFTTLISVEKSQASSSLSSLFSTGRRKWYLDGGSVVVDDVDSGALTAGGGTLVGIAAAAVWIVAVIRQLKSFMVGALQDITYYHVCCCRLSCRNYNRFARFHYRCR